MRAIAALACFLIHAVLLALEQATAQTSWTLVGTNRTSVPQAFDLKTCRNVAAVSTKGNANETAALYRFTFPVDFNATNVLGGSSANQKAVVQPVYYSGLGMYIFFTTPNVPQVLILSRDDNGVFSYYGYVNTLSTPYHMLLDPAYPLLYVAGLNFVGIINISNPTTAAVLAQFQRTDVITDAFNYQLGLLDGGTRLVATAAPAYAPIAQLYDLGQDLSSFAPIRSFSATGLTLNSYCTGVVVDPLGKYLLCMATEIRILQPFSPYNTIGVIQGSPVPTAATFLGDYLITTYGNDTIKVFALQNSTWTGTMQLVDLVEQSSAVSMTFNTLRAMQWRDGMLYTVDSINNVAQSVVVTSNASVDITGLTRSFPEAQACNKSVGISSMPALVMTATVPLVVDAQNLLAVSKSQLRLYDGAKDLRWNAIRYTITSISNSCAFQLYNNNTQMWSTTTTFLQTNIDDGMIRILPPASFQSQCAAGTATPFTGSFTFTAQDVWTRNASGTVSFAVVCCPNTTQTVSPSLTVASIGASPSTAAQYCTVPMPGYYTDALSSVAKPCPYGTFKPQVGGGAMRDVCLSCPDGANTSTLASTSWSQCSCQYCYIRGPITVNGSYTFCAKPLVSSPHVDRPLLFTTAFRGVSDMYMAFTPYLLSNGSVNTSLSPFYETYVGGYFNSWGGMRSTAAGNDQLSGPMYVLGADFYVQVWYFYWQGYRAVGLVPTDVDLQTSSTFVRDNLLATMLAKNDLYPTPATVLLAMNAPAVDPRIPILDIGLGTYDNILAQFKNFWNIQFDDMIDDYQLVMPRASLQLTSTFAYNAIPQMSVTVLPVDSLNATWTILQGTVNCTWINHSLNYYDFDLATPFVGSSVTWAISDGTTNVNNWANATSFTHAQMTAGLVYLRMLVPQSAFSQNWFTLPFTVRNPMIRVATNRISYLNFTLPPLPSNGALEISSWKWITGGNVGCVNPTYPTLGTFSPTATPGTRYGSALAMLGNSIYLFGGIGCSAPTNGNDLWQFNLTSGQWGWISGSSSNSPVGTYGTKGTPAAGNVPRGRTWGSMVADSSRNVIWLFGGQTQNWPYANDMWKYDTSTGYWTWVAGETSPTCGTIQTTQNEPCSTIAYGGLAMDNSNRVVVFGANAFGWNSPLWVFDPVASSWILLNPTTASTANDWVESDGVTGIIGGRWEHQVVITPENQLYVLFGRNTSSSTPYNNAVWRYNMSSSTPAYWQRVRPHQTLPPAAPLVMETTVSPRSRGVFSTVADAFGNVYVSSGGLSSSGPNAADLLAYNILANTWMRLAGPDAVLQTSDYPGSIVIKGTASSLNQLPSSYTCNALFVKTSTNRRYYTIYAIATTEINTGIFSIDIYVPPSKPSIKTPGAISYERWGQSPLVLNGNMLRVLDYDSPASQISVTITASSNVTFLSLVTGLAVTSFTYDAITNGSQIAMSVGPSYVGTSLSIAVTLNDTDGNLAGGIVNISLLCSGANTDSASCTCAPGYTLSGGVCAPCASGNFKAVSGNITCAPCPANATASGLTGQSYAETACLCNAGFHGLTFNSTTCSVCPSDTFRSASMANAANCTSCPTGSSTYGATCAPSASACVALPGFVPVGSGSFGCPPGSQVVNDSICVQCASGSAQGSASLNTCVACAQGWSTFGKTGLAECLSTQAYQNSSSGGIECTAGYTSDGSYCVACLQDSFKTIGGNSSCSLCPSGLSTNNKTAQTSADACSVSSSASSASLAVGGSALAAVIGGAVAGAAALVLLALLAVMYAKRQRKKAKVIKPASKANSIAEFPRGTPLTGSMVGISTIPRMTGTPTVSIRPLYATMGHTVNLSTKTSALSSATATCIPTHNLAAFPGFLLINSRSGFIKKRQIAEGGFGKIFVGELIDVSVMARDQVASGANRTVAIKLFESSETEGVANRMADLENEAAVLYALSSLSNVTRLIAVSKEPDLAIVLKLYEDSAHAVIHKPESSFRDYALGIMEQSWIRMAHQFALDLLAGVDGMHSLSVCHLDIKPQNLLLERLPNDGFRLVIGDFGLARISKNTAFDNIAGRIQTAGLSIQYAAPEAYNVVRLLEHRAPVDPQVFYAMDVYSTAISLWEIFARRVPLPDLIVTTADQELLNGKRPSLAELPVPKNRIEKRIMQAVTLQFESGWSSLPGRRPHSRDLYTALKAVNG